MLKIKTTGKWKQLNALMRDYPKRVEYVEQRIARDAAVALLEKVKDEAPEGSEYAPYISSLEVVEVTGPRGVSYGVVASPDRVTVQNLVDSEYASRTAVWIAPAASGRNAEVGRLLSSVNPWPMDMIPNGVKKKDVILIHRMVSEVEKEHARSTVREFVRQNRELMRRYGLYWGEVDNESMAAGSMTSMPDYLWLALRTEFGINMKAQSHWRPAVSWLVNNLLSIIEDDRVIKETLTNELSREHTLNEDSDLYWMKKREFDKRVGTFQRKVLGK